MSTRAEPAHGRTAAELAAAVRGGRTSAASLVEAALDAALAAERAGLNAFVARHGAVRGAFAGAEQGGAGVGARRRAARGAGGGAMAGVPWAASDDLADLALPTTCGSRALAGYLSPFEATAVARLLDAGGVLVGKTNVAEFGVSRDTGSSAYGRTLHPADGARAVGGAAGGLAVAVASGVVRLGVGVDAGGDLRLPAALCGVVAIKPTYGRVSRVGAVTHAPSLAQVGAVGRAVDDAALALEVACGRDPLDATSADIRASVRAGAGPVEDGRPLRDVRVGRAREAIAQADPDVAAAVEAALVSMRDLGAEVRDVTVPHAELVAPCHQALAAVECASALARFDGARFGPRFDAPGVRALVERGRGERLGAAPSAAVVLGTHLAGPASGGLLAHAQAARAKASEALVDLFHDVDLVVAPTSLRAELPLGAPPIPPPGGVDHAEALVLGANLAGLPALTLPIGGGGRASAALHLVGQHFGEPLLVRAAAALERLANAESRTWVVAA